MDIHSVLRQRLHLHAAHIGIPLPLRGHLHLRFHVPAPQYLCLNCPNAFSTNTAKQSCLPPKRSIICEGNVVRKVPFIPIYTDVILMYVVFFPQSCIILMIPTTSKLQILKNTHSIQLKIALHLQSLLCTILHKTVGAQRYPQRGKTSSWHEHELFSISILCVALIVLAHLWLAKMISGRWQPPVFESRR